MGKRNIPEIRFKGFDGEWEEKRLEEVGKVFDGTHFTPTYTKYGIPFYSVESVVSGVPPKFISLDDHIKNTQTNKPQKGDILITRIGSLCNVKQMECESEYSIYVSLADIQVTKKFHSKFILYYLQTEMYKKDFLMRSLTTAVPQKINMNDLKSTIVKYSKNLSEQTRIATLFTTLDKQISVSEAKLEKLRVIKKTLLKKMFAASGEKTPEIRFKGFEGEWEEKKMGEIENATYSKGNGYSKNCLADNGTPIILYGRLYTNYQTEITTINTFVKNILTNSVYSNGGEIIIPASGETAEDIAIAATVKEKGILLGGDLNIIKPNKDIFNSIFLSLGISNGKTKKILSSYAQGKSVVHLHNTDIQKINISIPTLTEQSQIANLFTTLDKQISIQEQKIDKLRAVKNTLLKKMFV